MILKKGKLNLINLILIAYIFSIIVFPDGSNVQKIIRIMFVVISLGNILQRKKFFINKYIIWMLLFFTICTASIGWSVGKENTSNMIKTLLYNMICNFCVINLVWTDKSKLNLIIKTIIFSSIFLFIRVSLQYGMFVYLNSRGGTNGVDSANTIGMIAAVSIILGMYFVIEEKKYNTILYKIAILLNTLIVVLSASRKAILFVLIPIIVYIVLKSKSMIKLLKNIILILFFVIFTYFLIMEVPVLYEIVGYRFETMINGFTGKGTVDGSTSLRLKMINWGIEWFKEAPYFGHGIDTFRNLLGQERTSYGARGAYAHNNYIELLVDVGIVGVSIYYYIYFVIIIKLLKKIKERDTIKLLALGIMISFCINEFGQVAYYSKFNQLVLTIIYILAISEKSLISEKKQKEKNESE